MGAVETLAKALVLRTIEGVNLLYSVEFESNGTTDILYQSENYFQALTVAKKVFDKLKTKGIHGLDVIIDSEYGRGCAYDHDQFSFDCTFRDNESFYVELCNDIEQLKFEKRISNNEAFRKIVNREKLNEYQEQKLLKWIKKLNA